FPIEEKADHAVIAGVGRLQRATIAVDGEPAFGLVVGLPGVQHVCDPLSSGSACPGAVTVRRIGAIARYRWVDGPASAARAVRRVSSTPQATPSTRTAADVATVRN